MINLQGITIGYNPGEPIIKNLSLQCKEQQITSIIGPNGSGKSTIVKCINKQLPFMEGKILIEGKNLIDMSTYERARNIAIMPQIRSSIPELPVEKLIEHGRFPYMGFTRKKSSEDIEKIEEAMVLTNTTALRHKNTSRLSGGERQRVFLAMILAQDSPFLIFDEPTTHLDLKSQLEFLELLKKLRAMGKTILLILHDLSQALTISDSIAVLQQGELKAFLTPSELLKTALIQEVFQVTPKCTEDGYIVFDVLQ